MVPAASLEPVGNFNQPVFVTSHPDDPDLLYVVEKTGTIQSYEDGRKTLFLDISDRVNPGERRRPPFRPSPGRCDCRMVTRCDRRGRNDQNDYGG